MLRRDLTGVTAKPGTKNCVIASGTLADKYTGKTINFVRGRTPPSSRSTTSSRCPWRGRPAPSRSAPTSAFSSPTTR